MGSDDAEGSGAEAPEGEGRAESSSFPQSSGKEVVLPTGKDGEHPTADTEATLLAELQRRCDKIIELEVRLLTPCRAYGLPWCEMYPQREWKVQSQEKAWIVGITAVAHCLQVEGGAISSSRILMFQVSDGNTARQHT